MVHPNEKIRKNQSDFLNQCPLNDREFHATLFRIGNAAYIYHQLACDTSDKMLESYYYEWLDGLPAKIKEYMKEQGFERCQSVLPFTRYVNERTDIGMDELMKEHLSKEDYKFWKSNK